jgi:uncharacterized protein YbaP (TraB family)
MKLAAAAFLAVFAMTVCHAGEQGLFYTVSKDGELRGYLLGTIHSDDPRLLDFSAEFTDALKSCDLFAMELVPNQPTLSRLMEFMHYQDGTTLLSRVGEARYQRLVSAAGTYNLGPDQLSTMKVWAAMMTVSIPPPENGLFMDLSLALQAAGNGLKVVGLETLDEQLAFLENMPEAQQLELLDQALDEFDQLPELFAKLIDAYLQSDLEALEAESNSQFEDLPDEIEAYFFSQGIDARNLRMRDRLLEQIAESTVFAAVGALHLPGEHGLIKLLREAGYSVEPAPFSPFAGKTQP